MHAVRASLIQSQMECDHRELQSALWLQTWAQQQTLLPPADDEASDTKL